MARSTLELLLDSIKGRDDEPLDCLPALPQRPTSRARLPSRKKTSAWLLDQSSDQHLQQRSSHAANALSQYSNGNRHQEDDANVTGCPPAFENGSGKETRTEGGLVHVQDNAMASLELCSNKSSSNDNDRLVKPELLPKKQGPAPDYVTLKRRRRDHHLHGLRKDSHVWIMNEDNTWVLGSVKSLSASESSVLCTANDMPFEISCDKLLPVNPEFLDGMDNLVDLIYIHEPAVFHLLQQRYERGMFCTRAGSSCIVLGPPQECIQSCYRTLYQRPSKDLKSMIVGSKWSHVYTIADNAHNLLIKDWKSQSIIIGGESCAGKTESVAAVLYRLISLGNNEELGKALANCNVVLEAFGNAMIANGVSASQNGKLIDVNFDRRGHICSAHIQILLFEKSRVVCQAEKELSFHIFYQLCELADASMREKLNSMNATHFNYLNGPWSINGAHPFSDSQSLINALEALGFTKKNQRAIISLLGAILWLGNIKSAALVNNEAVDNAADLLNCSKKDLLEALTAGSHDTADVSVARDALACALYERLFNWLVFKINKALAPTTVSEFKSITIVNMPGFRSSKNDGLGSLLVNYAQDHLHQFTRHHLLQQWKEVASAGGLRSYKTHSLGDDGKISFLENDFLPLLVSLEKDASDESSESVLLRKIERLSAGSMCCKQLQNGTFKLAHIAGEATYSAVSFLKDMKYFSYLDNSQPLQSWINKLLETATFKKPENISQILSEDSCWKQPSFSNRQKQVLHMMHHLEETEPLFVFCITPSKSKLILSLEQGHVIQQMRINSIIESVRFSRLGHVFCSPIELFARRFEPLLLKDMKQGSDPLGIAAAVLQQLRVPPCVYQMGWTHIFICLEQVERLEHARQKLLNSVITVQKSFRGFKTRKTMEKQTVAATRLQAIVRGWLLRKGLLYHHKDKAEIKTTIFQSDERGANQMLEHSKQILGVSQDCMKDGMSLGKEGSDTASSVNIPSSNGRLSDLQQEELPPKKGENIAQANRFPKQLNEKQGKDSKLALHNKDEETAILQQNIKEYERKWVVYEAKMKSMEEMWQKQVAHLEQKLRAATKGSNTEESAYKTGDSDKAVVLSTPRYESTGDTPETASVEPDVAKNGLESSRSALDKLSKELEHRTQVFNDDAKFLVEVKSGQITANFKPDEELQKLQQRFEVWKKDYRERLKETKGILKKLEKSSTNEKNRKRWWSRK